METITATPADDPPHDWREAGDAWGHAAADWACLYERYSLDLVALLHRRLPTGPGVQLLDVACGAGLALRHAELLGATVSGIDAAEALVDIARVRLPDADLHLGSMFELPWPDGSFDVVTSINGVWGGCQGALEEAHRVLRPGGSVAITFWGRGTPLDFRPVFKAFARHAPAPHLTSMQRLNDIATPGVAEQMLETAGFEVQERLACTSVVEWPDADLAWRALTSVGPAVPALRAGDREGLRRDVLDAIEPCRDERGTYRFQNDHQALVARKPGDTTDAPGALVEP